MFTDAVLPGHFASRSCRALCLHLMSCHADLVIQFLALWRTSSSTVLTRHVLEMLLCHVMPRRPSRHRPTQCWMCRPMPGRTKLRLETQSPRRDMFMHACLCCPRRTCPHFSGSSKPRCKTLARKDLSAEVASNTVTPRHGTAVPPVAEPRRSQVDCRWVSRTLGRCVAEFPCHVTIERAHSMQAQLTSLWRYGWRYLHGVASRRLRADVR